LFPGMNEMHSRPTQQLNPGKRITLRVLILAKKKEKSFVDYALERGPYANADSMRKNPSLLINIQCGPSYKRSRARWARVDLLHPVCLVQPNKPDRPNRPNEQERLADFFSILPKRVSQRGKTKLFSDAARRQLHRKRRLSLHCSSGLWIMRKRFCAPRHLSGDKRY
jgi:hypothetical protein